MFHCCFWVDLLSVEVGMAQLIETELFARGHLILLPSDSESRLFQIPSTSKHLSLTQFHISLILIFFMCPCQVWATKSYPQTVPKVTFRTRKRPFCKLFIGPKYTK